MTTHNVGGGDAVWIVLERRDDGMSARVMPGRIAGTISVHCSPHPSGEGTQVTVRYDITSLGPGLRAFVEEVEPGYDAFMAEWRREILAGIG